MMVPSTLRSFNPLTRIRSFLTEVEDTWQEAYELFQSPHEDSFFSDLSSRRYEFRLTTMYRFNPLTRIRSFLTPSNFRGYEWEKNSLIQIETLDWPYICCDLVSLLYPPP